MERARRSTAGNRLARLLDTEEEDEFYSTTYGGFMDAAGDRDYVQEKEADDVVDSDFDQEEDDEPVSGGEEDEKRPRKSGGTKAYKDPKKKANKTKTSSDKPKREEKKKESREEITDKTETPDGDWLCLRTERKSIRTSTAVKSAEMRQRIKIRTELSKQKKKLPPPPEYEMPTQEELLEEAKITEQENLQSLELFEQSELEKKKARPTKKSISGPLIRYHSFTVPLVEEPSPESRKSRLLEVKEECATGPEVKPEVAVDARGERGERGESGERGAEAEGESPMDVDGLEGEDNKEPKADVEQEKKQAARAVYERTLLTFESDIKDEAFNAAFPKPRVAKQRRMLCAVTKRPARYLDPVTRLPYSCIDAFRIIREAYYQQLEARGDRGRPDVAAWLAWRAAGKRSPRVQVNLE